MAQGLLSWMSVFPGTLVLVRGQSYKVAPGGASPTVPTPPPGSSWLWNALPGSPRNLAVGRPARLREGHGPPPGSHWVGTGDEREATKNLTADGEHFLRGARWSPELLNNVFVCSSPVCPETAGSMRARPGAA